MKLYLPITVDLYNIYPLRVLNLQQNNVGRGALITLTAAGAVIVPDSESLYVYAQKQDGTVVYNTCTLKDNQIQVDFDEQMTVVPGILQVELQMVDTTGNSITTPIFQVNVQNSNIDYERIVSNDSFQALKDALISVENLKKTGLKGDKGDAATIQVGTVTASEAGSSPTITNSGTEQKAVFDFVLPRGETGPRGPAGPAAAASDVTYDGTTSGVSEANAQEALDKLYAVTGELTENKANKDHSHAWSTITGKPSSFNPASHTHDDRYYTESEMNAKLNEKLTKSLIKKKTVSSNSPDWVNAGLPVASTIFLDANVISSSKGDTNFTCVPYYNKDAKGVFLRIKDLNNNIAGSATYKVDIKYIELTL